MFTVINQNEAIMFQCFFSISSIPMFSMLILAHFSSNARLPFIIFFFITTIKNCLHIVDFVFFGSCNIFVFKIKLYTLIFFLKDYTLVFCKV